jgi:hypothetical protein
MSGLTVTLQPIITIPEVDIDLDYGDGTGWLPFVLTHTYSSCGNYIITRRVKPWFTPDTCREYCAVNLPCDPAVDGLVEADEDRAIAVHPNPCGEIIVISPPCAGTVEVTDICGRVALSERTGTCPQTLVVGDLCPGTYYISIRCRTGPCRMARIIKM